MDHKLLPKARNENLIVEELDGEVLVYDIDRNRAHCLNSTAALVWKHCDGRTTVEGIARQLNRATDTRFVNVSESKSASDVTTTELVWLALEQLNRDHLLIEQTFARPPVPTISRREALRRVGVGAAIAVPIVASITAPTAVQAGTCGHTNSNCTTGAECCSGICSGGKCT